MNARKLFLFTLAGFAISASGIASASSLYHSVGGEAGATFHPEHSQSIKTRSDVSQELSEARKNGSFAFLSKGAPLPPMKLETSRSREQIQQEFLSMSEAEKKRWKELYSN
jgi:hypothetical protein